MYEDDTPRAERRAQVLSLDRDLLKELLGQEELRDLIDPGRARGGRGAAAREPAERGPAARRAPAPRRPAARSVRHCSRRAAARRASSDHGEDRGRGAARRRRRRRALPRRARRHASGRPARGLPRGRQGRAREPRRALRQGPRAVHDGRGERPFRDRRRAGAAGARAGGAARPRRASAGRDRARVVRPGRPSAAAPSVAGRAAQGGRAGRAGDSRPLPAQLARDRSAREPPRGARAAPGACLAGRPSGKATSCRAGSRITSPRGSTSCARPASSSGSERASTAWPSTSARTLRLWAASPAADAAGRRGARPDSRRARPRRRVLVRPARRGRSRGGAGAAALCGTSSGRARSRTTPGRRFERVAATASLGRSADRGASLAAARPGSPPPRAAGRSPTSSSRAPPDRRALAELLLERQGIVTRDGVRAEGITGGYSAVYGELKALETLGLSRRGYFVEGLGGAQFALGGAVERLRELRPKEGEEPEAFVIAAADPAQPYGAALPWPKPAGGRAARVAGAQVVLLGGEPALFVERGGRSIVSLREPDEEWLRPALAALVEHVKDKRGKRLAVERFDGEPVGETELMPLLLEAGFLAGPRRAVLRPGSRPGLRKIGTNPARCRHRFLGTLTLGGGWNFSPPGWGASVRAQLANVPRSLPNRACRTVACPNAGRLNSPTTPGSPRAGW